MLSGLQDNNPDIFHYIINQDIRVALFKCHVKAIILYRSTLPKQTNLFWHTLSESILAPGNHIIFSTGSESIRLIVCPGIFRGANIYTLGSSFWGKKTCILQWKVMVQTQDDIICSTKFFYITQLPPIFFNTHPGHFINFTITWASILCIWIFWNSLIYIQHYSVLKLEDRLCIESYYK